MTNLDGEIPSKMQDSITEDEVFMLPWRAAVMDMSIIPMICGSFI